MTHRSAAAMVAHRHRVREQNRDTVASDPRPDDSRRRHRAEPCDHRFLHVPVSSLEGMACFPYAICDALSVAVRAFFRLFVRR